MICFALREGGWMHLRLILLSVIIVLIIASAAHARTICTIIADAETEKILLQQGNCKERITPASTFKIAISLMGFDSGFLKDEHSPVLAYHEGDVDWGGAAWRQPIDPMNWIKYSVVWFSQRVTQSLGKERFQRYVSEFQYGNADVSGDSGRDNGMLRSWINSSLKISPLEQVSFLEKVVKRQLPVTAHAFDMTNRLTEVTVLPGGWDIHGKTGTGSPGEGAFDKAHSYGWFVGWATKKSRTFVFVHLIQDEKLEQGLAGVRSRDAFLNELPSFLDAQEN